MYGDQSFGTDNYAYWESGAWRNVGQTLTRRAASYGSAAQGWGQIIGGVAGTYAGFSAGTWAGGKIGGVIGSYIMPGLGTIVGAAIGGIIGGAAAYFGGVGVAHVTHGISAGYNSLMGKPGAYEFRIPFVNTRMAATQRQAGMQSIMSSAANYRMILGREAARFHK